MAREIKRRFNTAARNVVIEIEDDFGNVSHHSIPLLGDTCHHCGQTLPGTSGAADVNAAAEGLVKHIDGMQPDLIAKFEAAAQGDPALLAHVHKAKERRNGHT